MRGLVSRTPTAALHVHVGMPDPETAIARLQPPARAPAAAAGARRALAVLARPRLRLRQRALGDLPRLPALDDPADVRGWEHYAGGHRAGAWPTGELADYTFLWWDIRPSPHLGTVEVRAMDAQSRLETRRRARRARPRARGRLRRRRGGARAADRGARWSPRSAPRATASTRRSGGAARCGRCARSARDALALARPYARDLDGEDALEEIERILREGGGADRMREAHAAGGMDERARPASPAETYGSTQTTSPIRSQS